MFKRRTNRRQFILGRSAADALSDLADGAVQGSGAQLATPAGSYLVQVGRQAMACRFEVRFNAGQYPQATEAALAALDLVDELEAQLTVYRDTSEVAEVNRRAAIAPMTVERGLFDLLSRAVRLHAETGGAFDVTAGPLTKVWGFYRGQGAIPTPAALAAARAVAGSANLLLDDNTCSVYFARPGMEINLGAIGKGYALDRAADLMLAAGVRDFLWQAGASSVLARGNLAIDGTSGWKIGVRHPLQPAARLAEIVLRDRALATSGAGTQFFRHAGRRFGHLIDPRSGQPADGVISATAVAANAADADALSTACFILGRQGSKELCDRRGDLSALLVVPASDGSSVLVESSGFPEGMLKLADRANGPLA